jgi:hypothetical protein
MGSQNSTAPPALAGLSEIGAVPIADDGLRNVVPPLVLLFTPTVNQWFRL